MTEQGRAGRWLVLVVRVPAEPSRLRRWHRELAARDVFGAPGAAEALQQLKHCAERLAEYTDLVFRAIHQM